MNIMLIVKAVSIWQYLQISYAAKIFLQIAQNIKILKIMKQYNRFAVWWYKTSKCMYKLQGAFKHSPRRHAVYLADEGVFGCPLMKLLISLCANALKHHFASIWILVSKWTLTLWMTNEHYDSFRMLKSISDY